MAAPERDAERLVLALHPRAADAEDRAAVGDVVEGGGELRGEAGAGGRCSRPPSGRAGSGWWPRPRRRPRASPRRSAGATARRSRAGGPRSRCCPSRPPRPRRRRLGTSATRCPATRAGCRTGARSCRVITVGRWYAPRRGRFGSSHDWARLVDSRRSGVGRASCVIARGAVRGPPVACQSPSSACGGRNRGPEAATRPRRTRRASAPRCRLARRTPRTRRPALPATRPQAAPTRPASAAPRGRSSRSTPPGCGPRCAGRSGGSPCRGTSGSPCDAPRDPTRSASGP